MSQDYVALSVKQPWAALLALGAKTIEVRTWKTHRRGPVLIHASKVPDPRPEAWAWITSPQLIELSQVLGGVIAIGELCDCRHYDTQEKFRADHGLHLNSPEWFQEQGLFGFVFRQMQRVEFTAVSGNTFFFPISGFDLKLPPSPRP
jgi:hypothetical protein